MMDGGYSRIEAIRKNGDESFHNAGKPLGPTLLDSWRWNSSDLVSNANRGWLAEFIVASALGLTDLASALIHHSPHTKPLFAPVLLS